MVAHECVVLQSEVQLQDVCLGFLYAFIDESDAAGFIVLVATDANLRAYLVGYQMTYSRHES